MPNSTREKKELDEALGATEFGFTVYTADPGERIPWGMHRYPVHEELFSVLSGELLAETPESAFKVEPEEAFFVPTDRPNRAGGRRTDRGRRRRRPQGARRAVIEEPCPVCGEVSGREYESAGDGDDEEYARYCTDRGAETDRFCA